MSISTGLQDRKLAVILRKNSVMDLAMGGGGFTRQVDMRADCQCKSSSWA